MKLLVFFLIVCAFVISAHPTAAQQEATPADLRKLADDYYNWRNQQYPVTTSDAGLHTWDNKLTDYELSALLARRLHVKEVLGKVKAMQTAKWSKDDRIDWLLFRSQLESAVFFDRVMDFEETDPQTYVNECSNGIFSLLEKRLRHATQSLACRHGATEADALRDRAGQTESQQAGAALRAARDRFGALDRQPVHRQPDDTGHGIYRQLRRVI